MAQGRPNWRAAHLVRFRRDRSLLPLGARATRSRPATTRGAPGTTCPSAASCLRQSCRSPWPATPSLSCATSYRAGTSTCSSVPMVDGSGLSRASAARAPRRSQGPWYSRARDLYGPMALPGSCGTPRTVAAPGPQSASSYPWRPEPRPRPGLHPGPVVVTRVEGLMSEVVPVMAVPMVIVVDAPSHLANRKSAIARPDVASSTMQ